MNHQRYIHLTTLVCRKFIVQLGIMQSQLMDLFFPLPP